MPSKVAVNVKNCATARQTFAAMSLSLLMVMEVKHNATATMNDAVAMVFSNMRFCFITRWSIANLMEIFTPPLIIAV